MHEKEIVNLASPTNQYDAATKKYVDKTHLQTSIVKQNIFVYLMRDVDDTTAEDVRRNLLCKVVAAKAVVSSAIAGGIPLKPIVFASLTGVGLVKLWQA